MKWFSYPQRHRADQKDYRSVLFSQRRKSKPNNHNYNTMRTFIPEDFSGAGHYLIRNDKERNKFVDSGFMSTVMYKVGYHHGHGMVNRPESNVICLVSMADGWTQTGYFDKHNSTDTKDWEWKQWNSWQGFCDWLNNEDRSQEMRFASQEEVVRVVLYQSARWR